MNSLNIISVILLVNLLCSFILGNRIVFPNSSEEILDISNTNTEQDKIPIDDIEDEMPVEYAFKMNGMKESDFMAFFNMTPEFTSRSSFSGRDLGVEPEYANCLPEMKTISFDTIEKKDRFVKYFPPCTRVQRCGGCCGHESLQCEPTKSELVQYKVASYRWQNGKNNLLGHVIIPVEKHLECKCACVIKKEDCNQLKVYNEQSCTCNCKNLDDQIKCKRNARDRRWDKETCSCQCTKIKDCTTGYFFNLNTCLCEEELATGVRNVDISPVDRKKFIVRPMQVSPSEDTKYQTDTTIGP